MFLRSPNSMVGTIANTAQYDRKSEIKMVATQTGNTYISTFRQDIATTFSMQI